MIALQALQEAAAPRAHGKGLRAPAVPPSPIAVLLSIVPIV